MRADSAVRDLGTPHPSPQPARANAPWTALTSRLSGPGGYYNIGNALALSAGLTIQFATAAANQSAYDKTLAYFAGNSGGLAITISTLIFFVSGEAYHRAWANGFPPDARLNFHGDFLSGLGALMLGIGLFALGDPFMAATSGLLHAAGKFGSAFYKNRGSSSDGIERHKLFRMAVLLSRAPALLISTVALLHGVSTIADGGSALTTASAASLIACYLLWAKADLLLLRPK